MRELKFSSMKHVITHIFCVGTDIVESSSKLHSLDIIQFDYLSIT